MMKVQDLSSQKIDISWLACYTTSFRKQIFTTVTQIKHRLFHAMCQLASRLAHKNQTPMLAHNACEVGAEFNLR